MNKISPLLVSFLIVFCNTVFCQYETISLPEQVPTNWQINNFELAFATADTGYMTYNAYFNNTSTLVYLQSVDSGRNWHIIDTVYENFNVHQMCFNDGRGAIAGNVEDYAAIELFNSSLSQKSFHSFSELSVIYSFSIIDKDNIVFHGLTNDSQTCLGKIEIIDDIPQITTINVVPDCDNYQIYFNDCENGWYMSGSDFIYTEDLGLSESIVINNVVGFDFYDSLHGAVSITGESGLKFTEDGGLNWISGKSDRSDFNTSGFKMISENKAHSCYHWNGSSGVTYYYLHISGNPNPISIYSMECGSPNDSKGFTFGSQTYWIDSHYNLTLLLNNEYYTKVPAINSYTNISIFPVPARDQLHICLSESFKNNIKISIINEIGQTVYSSVSHFEENIFLDISNLESGVYTIKLISEEYLISERFIKL